MFERAKAAWMMLLTAVENSMIHAKAEQLVIGAVADRIEWRWPEFSRYRRRPYDWAFDDGE